MFDNLNGWELAGLLLLALLIFGERLPKVIGDGLRMLRNLRAMASNATGDLSRELGTDIKLEDLHPKNFVRKHILSEEDEAAIRRPLQSIYEDVKSDVGHLKDQASELNSTFDRKSGYTPPSEEPKPAVARNYDDMT